ncbi:MAG: hypothetical protein KDH19_17625, partial [Geminicoccaceae bacterium]|nr:hypothetical protein [Geminicoccaceae bacterium]
MDYGKLLAKNGISPPDRRLRETKADYLDPQKPLIDWNSVSKHLTNFLVTTFCTYFEHAPTWVCGDRA